MTAVSVKEIGNGVGGTAGKTCPNFGSKTPKFIYDKK